MLRLKVTSCFFSMVVFLLSTLSWAQVDDLKKIRSEKFKLKNQIKNLIHKKSESQRNILYIQDEIEETQLRIFDLRSKISKIEDKIKSNLGVFITSYIREKNHDLSFDSRIKYQIYQNWRKQESQVLRLKNELESTLSSLETSRQELKTFIKDSQKLTYRIESEVEELNEKQKGLKTKALSQGSDALFYENKEQLYWPVANARLIGSRGFYKIPGERVFDYNEGMKFRLKEGSKVYPIFRGIIEESLDIQELGPLIVVKHTENIRSFYIGVVLNSNLSEGSKVSPLKDMGQVQGNQLDLKLRFDTESLDPLNWVSQRR